MRPKVLVGFGFVAFEKPHMQPFQAFRPLLPNTLVRREWQLFKTV